MSTSSSRTEGLCFAYLLGRKLLKKDNLSAAKKATKAATLSDEDMAKL